MTLNKQNILLLIIAAIAGSILTLVVSSFVGFTDEGGNQGGEQKPLYWVAPMDPNYRRDEPGLSPMGMELVPVYAEDAKNGQNDEAGTVKISPDVVNNLGVRTTTAKMQNISSIIKTVGYVEYDEDQLVHIHPRVEGWIEKLYVKATGDPVNAGEPLYDLYSPTLVNAQEELVVALSRNNSQLISASEDRLKSLQIPEGTIETLKKTRKVKQTVTFYAPKSGVVDNLNIRQGFYVMPGTTMMSIGNLDQVWVEAEVFERQAAYVKNGTPVTMMVDYLPGEKWQGMVDYVQPALDPMTRTLKVRLRFENKNGRLKPNMFAQVELDTRQDGESLIVPKDAVIRTGGNDRVVLALDGGKFRSAIVRIGRVDDQNTEILSGINAGDKVVVSAQFLIDSESSKTADFKRMDHNDNQDDVTMNMGSSLDDPENWTLAKINSVDIENRTVNLTHGPIKNLGMMGMTMNFSIALSIDISTLGAGSEIEMIVEKPSDGMFEVTHIRPAGKE
ncbi:MAG: efflux RND transporter periplasmic adaptor subunit [Emcibacteraceae bacterium]